MEPQIIIDQPLPLLSDTVIQDVTTVNPASSPSLESSNGLIPQTYLPPPHPQPIISQHTISESLDTQSRKILGNYTFSKVGAMQVGTYVNGISGEIIISSDGIKSTNVNGSTTFTIDGSNGNATFLGTLSAGTLVGGDANVVIGGNASGGYITINISSVATILIGFQASGF